MRWVFLIIGWITCVNSLAQTVSLHDILEDIYGQMAEDNYLPMEDLTEQLINLAENPINLNNTNTDELQQLCWLNDEQIDDILLYQYLHPFVSIYDLQLIHSLKDYEIRNLLPFVYVGEKKNEDNIYLREVFYFAKHEITFRTDVRNIENSTDDPFYAKLRYRFNYNNQVQAGLTIGRPTGKPLKNMQYGAFIQLQDIGHIKTLTIGNFQANFGQGLVVGSPFKMGKSSYINSGMNAREGVRKFTSTSDYYQAFHGIGTTLRFNQTEVSAWYSINPYNDSTWHHLLGANITSKWNKLKIGTTIIENIYSDSTLAKAVIGLNARYNWGKIDVWSEVAATQAQRWGWGGILGINFTPISDITLLALYRYYSPYFDNPYAYAFSEKSRLNNENGFYLGTEIKCVANWRFAGYADIFNKGYDIMMQADFLANSRYDMNWRLRARQQTDKNKHTYAIRYRFTYRIPYWIFRTQGDANIIKKENWNYGISLLQDIEYHVPTIPIVLQLRVQLFDAREWDNRIYTYENDVLYAYSIPNVYGLGGRLWLNARYKINNTFSVYFRVSETIYQHTWANAHNKKNTRTDIHTLLRIKL